MTTIVAKRKQNLGEKIYMVALVLGISGSLLVGTMFSWASHAIYLVRIGIALCIIKSIFLDRYNFKQLCAYIICLGAAILSYDSIRHDMLLIIPFIFAAKDIDLKKIIKIYLITILILVLLVNILSIFGKIPNLIFYRDGKPRISYGFSYPTLGAAHIFYFVLAYVVYKKFKLSWIQIIITLLLGFFIISKNGSRLDGYLILIILVIIFLRKFVFKLLSKINNCIPAIVIVFLILGYIILAKNYNPMNISELELNNFLSNRLALTQQGLTQYPINLWGNHVQMQGFGGFEGLAMLQTSWLTKNYFYIDSSFVQILLINGSILFIITLIVFFYLTWKNMKLKNYSFVLMLMFLTVAGLIEGFTIQISYNIFVIMILANNDYWIKDRVKESNEY